MKFTLKSFLTLLAGVAVIVLVTVLLSQCMLAKPRSFDLDAQSDFIRAYEQSTLPQEFACLTQPVGAIDSMKAAQRAAESLWLQVYGQEITEQKPYEVYYDADAGVWCVCGSATYYPAADDDGIVMALLAEEYGRVIALGRLPAE